MLSNNFHNIKNFGEEISGGMNKAAILKAIIKKENFSLILFLNVDKTGLFWKRIPKQKSLSHEQHKDLKQQNIATHF